MARTTTVGLVMVLGWTLAGSAGFAAFLGLGLIVWVDRSGEAA